MSSAQSDERIHVMQVTFGMVIGGLERVIMELCRYVDPARYRLSICCIGRRGPLADVMEAEGVPVIVCENQSRWAKYLRGLELARLFKDRGVDLVHTHHTPAFIDGTAGAYLAGLPLINTDHCKAYPTAKRWQLLEKAASKYAKTVVAVSEHSRGDLERYQGIAADKLRVIYNGIDLKPVRAGSSSGLPAELGFQPGDVIIGTAARLEDQKGLDLLLHAAPQVIEAVPRARFLIIGGGGLEDSLREEASRLGLGSRVVITGYRTDAVDLMQHFACFVQTSHWEGMPMALLEAMALAKPIVATAVGGVPEVVQDGVTGLLLRSREPRALAEALIRVTSEPGLGRRLGEAGLQRYQQHFTAAAMVAQYEQLYSQTLGIGSGEGGKRTA